MEFHERNKLTAQTSLCLFLQGFPFMNFMNFLLTNCLPWARFPGNLTCRGTQDQGSYKHLDRKG